MNLYVGTSGYSYKEWKGVFYPADISADDMLRHFATRLPAVEINNTFYRLPKASVIESWGSQVPESFRFSIKASRRITHVKRLRNAESETEYLLTTLGSLGAKLGVILFQLPPYLHKDLDKLQRFLDLIPEGTRAALEFRHFSWTDDDVLEVLRDRKAGLVVADSDDGQPPDVLGTTNWGYLRFRKTAYTDQELASWVERVKLEPWTDAFVFFKHEDAVEGPELAAKFLELSGLPPT